MNKSLSTEKSCELCGVGTKNYIYRFIAEQKNTIFLNNPKIRYNDKEQRVLVLNDGSRLDYSWQVDENHVINFMELTLHIFCGEKCEDKFIAKYPVFFRQNIANDVLLQNWQKEKTFVPQVFQTEIFCPNNMWEMCDECGNAFPSTKAYPYIAKDKVSVITQSDVISGKLGTKPHKADNYDFTISNIHDKKPKGDYYMYKSNTNSFTEKMFCSKECAFNYCVKNNSISVSKNNLEKGSLMIITPHTKEINQDLGNSFIYRPHFLSYGMKQPENNIVTDIDSNVYQTIQIGKQIWMAENLKVTHYRNGDPIPNITDQQIWVKAYKGAYCDYDNDEDNVETYGRLYNWYAVGDERGLAPSGWHVPTASEWKKLVDYLGGDYVAAGSLIDSSRIYWKPPKSFSEKLFALKNIFKDKSGFSARPGGGRGSYDGNYGSINTNCLFWSSAKVDYGSAYYIEMNNRSLVAFIESMSTKYGMSIRCIKD